MTQEVLKQALEALEDNFDIWTAKTKAITAIKEALAQPQLKEQDMSYDMIDRFLRNNLDDDDYAKYSLALDQVASPPQRTWLSLTDEEMYTNCPNWLSQEQCKVWIKQIEAKLKEKNT